MPEFITRADWLYRRLFPSWVTADGRVHSVAYMLAGKPDPQVSVNLARMAGPDSLLGEDYKIRGCGVGELSAAHPLDEGLEVVHAPADDNPAHALITGNTSRAICRVLADHTAVRIAPSTPEVVG